ncbi:glucosyl/glucuronosyl transferases, putative [Ricinus communis]|uniref:Glucosyl/glucuronosyl transferases, putative n=1 Tax=Ricinus communis TaxID=3988 RepID=B9RLQ3_RICCO|nr:glucosyl/glucuronosyl transferases, putative [Ricinus communis]
MVLSCHLYHKKLVHRIADHGLNVTVLTTEAACARLAKGHSRNGAMVVSVPDDLETEDERRDEMKAMESFAREMPARTVNFINKVNQPQNDHKITCMISDLMNTWSLEIARKMELKLAIYEPVVPGCLAAWLKLSDLLEAGIIDDKGN